MAVSENGVTATGVGIMMENGSGGFMSDLTFFGGNAGILAGSQQFTFSKPRNNTILRRMVKLNRDL